MQNSQKQARAELCQTQIKQRLAEKGIDCIVYQTESSQNKILDD